MNSLLAVLRCDWKFELVGGVVMLVLAALAWVCDRWFWRSLYKWIREQQGL